MGIQWGCLPLPIPIPGGCSEQPQPHMCPQWARRSCCHHTGGGSTFPSWLKSSFYLGKDGWSRADLPQTALPSIPRPGTTGAPSILPGKSVPAPPCPKLLELSVTHPGLRGPGAAPPGRCPEKVKRLGVSLRGGQSGEGGGTERGLCLSLAQPVKDPSCWLPSPGPDLVSPAWVAWPGEVTSLTQGTGDIAWEGVLRSCEVRPCEPRGGPTGPSTSPPVSPPCLPHPHRTPE